MVYCLRGFGVRILYDGITERKTHSKDTLMVGLWCLTSLSTIFQLYRGGSVLFVEETGVPGENHRLVASH